LYPLVLADRLERSEEQSPGRPDIFCGECHVARSSEEVGWAVSLLKTMKWRLWKKSCFSTCSILLVLCVLIVMWRGSSTVSPLKNYWARRSLFVRYLLMRRQNSAWAQRAERDSEMLLNPM